MIRSWLTGITITNASTCALAEAYELQESHPTIVVQTLIANVTTAIRRRS
ncbi:hypothetical protein BH18THE2_BH18THE2_36080 [soil metagenome]